MTPDPDFWLIGDVAIALQAQGWSNQRIIDHYQGVEIEEELEADPLTPGQLQTFADMAKHFPPEVRDNTKTFRYYYERFCRDTVPDQVQRRLAEIDWDEDEAGLRDA